MAVVSFTLFDPYLNTTEAFDRNPREMDVAGVDKNVGQEPTSASDGAVIVFEGAQPKPELTMQGYALSIAQRDKLIIWANKRYQVQLTDDLGQSSWIYFTKLTFKRKNSANYALRLEYTLAYIELDVS